MKNLKKVIALIAVLAMTLSTVALGATYTDVADDSAYSVAVESLSKLGIVTGYEDGTFGPEQAVTRAEMAALIARIQGYEESAKANANTAFTDVPYEYWASGYVAQAANQGFVNGYGDGTFGPDDSVTYEQAVTMIMRTLGYSPFAANNGGYPTGYLAAAQRYGVSKGVSNAVAGTDANRGTIAQLLYNAIDTAMMAQSKWASDGTIEYTIYDGSDYYTPYKTLMSENLGVVKLKGEITKTPYSSTSSTVTINNAERAKVKMYVVDSYDTTNDDFASENKSYDLLVGSSDVCDFLGYRVIAYVVESEEYADEYEVISVAKDSSTNNEVVVNLDQYDSVANKKLEYYKNDTDRNTTKLTLDSNVKVVYNNVGGYTTAIFGSLITKDMTEGGYIKLIDNDTEDGYDVIFVEVGATAVVDEVTKTKVKFKEAVKLPGTNNGSISSIDVDEDDDSERFVFIKDGEEIAVTDLVEWDVLTIVADSKSASYIVSEVIGAPVTGTISSTTSSDTSEGGKAFRIEGTTYDVAKNSYKTDGLDVGDAGIFYIDKYGKIAAFDEDSSVAGNAGNYAYVLKVSCDKDDFDEYTTQLKLVTANGVATYELADKTTVYYADTTKATVSTDEQTSGTDLANKCKNNLIKYTANSSGEITSITFADYNTDRFETVKAKETSNTEFDLDLMRIGNTNIDEDATLFLIDTSSDSDCMVGTIADLDDGQSYASYTAYLDNKGEDANLIVITGYKAAADSATIAVIASVGTAKNDELEDVYVLDYYMNGELHEGVYTNNDVYSKQLQGVANAALTEGDIVQLKVSSAGVVTGVNVLVDFADGVRTASGFKAYDAMGTKSNGAYTYTSGKLTTVFGYATGWSKSSKVATLGGKTYKLSKADNVYVIDPALKKNKVDVGAVGDYFYDEDLMGDYNTNNITVDGMTITGSNADSIYNKYADFVFVREYDNSIEDVVIIKAYDDDYSVDYKDSSSEYNTAYSTYAEKQKALNTAAAAVEALKDADGNIDVSTEAYKKAYDAYNAALSEYKDAVKTFNDKGGNVTTTEEEEAFNKLAAPTYTAPAVGGDQTDGNGGQETSEN